MEAEQTYDFNTLCLPHYDELVAYATKRTRDAQKARDIVQDSMVRALRAWDRWVPQGDPATWARAWLYRIVSNTFKMGYVRDRTLARLTTPSVDNAPTVSQVAGELHQNLTPVHPYTNVDTIGDEVREAMDRINPEWAEVVRLVYIEGMPAPEVAVKLKRAPGTIRSQMARGRLALARILAPMARQRFGFVVREDLPASSADEAVPQLESIQELESDADGVDGIVAEDGCFAFNFTEA